MVFKYRNLGAEASNEFICNLVTKKLAIYQDSLQGALAHTNTWMFVVARAPQPPVIDVIWF